MITTKKGDEGKSHFLGKVVDKDSPLLEAVGTIDELQAVLEIVEIDEKIINDLMEIMGFLVCNQKADFSKKVDFLEKEIKSAGCNLTEFVKFKGKKSLELNWARTVCRRAERKIVTLNKEQKINKDILKYFNRLSDYLFIKSIEQIKK